MVVGVAYIEKSYLVLGTDGHFHLCRPLLRHVPVVHTYNVAIGAISLEDVRLALKGRQW